MSIPTRLTVWFLLLLGAVLATFSVAIYQLTSTNLRREIEKDLRQRTSIIAAAVQPDTATEPLRLPHLDDFTAPDIYVQILDQQRTVLTSSGNVGDHVLPFLWQAITTDQVQEVQTGNMPLLVYGQPILVDHQLRGYVLVARSLRSIYMALGGLNQLLLPAVIVTLGLAGLVSWLVVRQTMHPLQRLAATASTIAATKDHSLRLHPQEPADEINHLAHTMNGMLQSLEDAYQQVQEVNALQRHFLADVSHELRTPLTIMLSSLDLIKKEKGTDPDFHAHALESIQGEAERMARMITQLLILARTDAHTNIAREPLLVVDLIAEICLPGCLPDKQISLTCQGLETVEDAVVLGNPDYLKQLFLILVENAFKYTSAGGSVEITGSLNENKIAITVADTGIGIATADLPRIFDRFYRAENARFRSGLGLGLSIAQSIVEQHAGKITVQSTVCEGSRFTVTLPLLSYMNIL